MMKTNTGEKSISVRLEQLHPFENHPFRVVEDDALRQLAQSIKENGVLTPCIVRPSPYDDGYELLSGHRRVAACRLIGRKTIPVIVRELDDDAATILMVDANQQRENLLPSEKAFAYRIKLEAMKRQGKKIETTSRQLVGKLERADSVSDESGRTIQRYIRLTYLEGNLLQMVDEGRIAFGPAVEISFLTHDEQCMLLETIITEEATPSLSRAQTLKKLSQEGKLDMDAILKILSEQKGNQVDRLKLREDKLREFFPCNYTPRQMEDVIFQLLEQWKQNGNATNNKLSIS
ncbi:ParB/RepB/Spo0J family partition protein [Clostridium sp. KNHs216]|uniref:ParB/RepB/Spo0J family partition protein n=1 Tax=Clostridium sp. KNHs216 TaxID=1550235 RepID=UPI001FAA87A4|nr:ParB/RepB/Spo0J family partition protein [Clostridium sp. KNHs216]